MLSETMNSVGYIYNADFLDLEELCKADVEEELAESMGFLLCKLSYHYQRQEEI